MPPPLSPARLFATRSRSNVTRKPLFSMPPPSAPAAFSVTRLSLIVTSPKLSMLMPPPSSVAVLPVNVVWLTSTGPPSVYRPPPPATFPTVLKRASPGTPTGRGSAGSVRSGTPPLLPEKVESRIVASRSLAAHAPPPSLCAPFFRNFTGVSTLFVQAAAVVAGLVGPERHVRERHVAVAVVQDPAARREGHVADDLRC